MKRRYKTDEERARIDDRDTELRCPFCRNILSGFREMQTPFGGDVEGGFCQCGGVFIYDRSGRMLGEAFTDAIALAYKWDYDAAMEGAHGGYEEAVIRFDGRLRKYLKGEGGRFDRNPKYYFVKRKKRPEAV